MDKKVVRKNLLAKVKDLGEGIIEAIVASDSLDRHGEIIDIKGMDLSKFKQNPVVAWAHNYDEPPIAKAISIKKTNDGKLISKMQFAFTDNQNPSEHEKFVRRIYDLYKGGFMKA